MKYMSKISGILGLRELRISCFSIDQNKFSLLGSPKCEILSMTDYKDEFTLSRLTEKSKKNCGI